MIFCHEKYSVISLELIYLGYWERAKGKTSAKWRTILSIVPTIVCGTFSPKHLGMKKLSMKDELSLWTNAVKLKLEKISVDDDRVILKDNIKNRIAEVAIQKGELFCQLCDEKDCVHVGFVFSLPDIYEVLNARGIKHPR